MSEITVDDGALVEDGFNAADYVNDFLRNVRSGDEVKKLQQLRTALGTKNASSSEAIKDIVFERYRQFIDTSKEVSNLEREIYQLSTFLMDQKQLIENLMEKVGSQKRQTKNQSTSSVGHPVQNPLQVLMQKMDGVTSVLNNLNENDRILLQNEVTLLNPDSMEEIHPVLLVLLSDLLLIGYPADTMSKFRYELHSTHTLDNLAVVNVKRTVGSKIPSEQILQFLIFPEQIYIKCDSPKIKREWFEGVEQAKRKQQQENLLHRQATIRAKRRSIIGNQGTLTSKSKPSVFSIEEEQDNKSEIEKQKAEELNQWLENLIGEVYDVISQREMEKAVEFINEWKESKCQDPIINSKWQAIERNVVKLLSDEVKSPGALHGNSNLLHRNMELLIALDRSTYAMDLFLKRRSKALRNAADELAVSEEPLSYVKQISAIFINGILDVAKEAYNQTNNLPQVLQFASSELKLLLNLIRRNVVEVAPTIA
uniref:Exocyst component Exo84 C-terminal domain-containing protein n=1 Tax=Panagrolaimus sp. JU765 TaxID=591449 RepID=A0AC34QX89_9BILA